MENDIKKAVEAYIRGKFDYAFEQFHLGAEAGNLVAMSNLGLMYSLGHGVERDLQRAIFWLTRAAEGGYGEAAHNLATLYVTSEPEIPRDAEKASYWRLKAKDLGYFE